MWTIRSSTSIVRLANKLFFHWACLIKCLWRKYILETKTKNKKGLAIALGNLYHPDKIEIPGKLVAGALAAAHLLKFEALKVASIEKMSNSLSKKTISDCYNAAVKVRLNYMHATPKFRLSFLTFLFCFVLSIMKSEPCIFVSGGWRCFSYRTCHLAFNYETYR